MYRGIILLVCSLVFAVGIAVSANATPLTDAVEEYNSVADDLQAYWDSYEVDLEEYFDRYEHKYDYFNLYLLQPV